MSLPALVHRSRLSNYPKLLVAVTLFLTAAVYWPGLSGDFTFDDRPNILVNEFMQIPDWSWESVKQAWFSGRSSSLGRPLSMLSFAANYRFSGLDPYAFKLTNLAIHLLNGILVLWISIQLLNIFQHDSFKTGINSEVTRYNPMLPWFVATAWLLNPLNLSPVLYVVQRMTSLSALFVFLGIGLYLHSRRKLFNQDHIPPSVAASLLFSFTGCTILAVLAKENGALLPLFLLLVEVSLFRFSTRSPSQKRYLQLLFLLGLALPALALAAYTAINPAWIFQGYEHRDFTLGQRLLSEPRVLGLYLQLAIAPRLEDFSIHHDDFAVSQSLLSPSSTLAWLLALLSLLIISWKIRHKEPLASLGIAFFFCGHLMESTLIPLELVHEHRNYVPDFGIMLTLGAVLLNRSLWEKSLHIRQWLALLFLVFFTSITHARASLWGNSAIHAITLQHNHPQSERVNIYASRMLVALYLHNTDKPPVLLAAAKRSLQAAFRNNPYSANSLAGQINLARIDQTPLPAGLVDQLRQTLKTNAHSAQTPGVFDMLVECQKEPACGVDRPTLDSLFQAAFSDPLMPRNIRAHLYFILARYSSEIAHNFDISMHYQRLAAKLEPNEIQHTLNAVRILTNFGRFDEASIALNEIERTPAGKRIPMTIRNLRSTINQQRKERTSGAKPSS